MSHEDTNFDAIRIEQLDEEVRREVITSYLDDELSPDAARHVTAWLDAHPDELKEVEHHRRVWDLLELYEDEAVPVEFPSVVLDETGASQRSRGRLLVLRPVFAAAAAAAIVVALGALLFTGRGGDEITQDDQSVDAALVLDGVPGEFLEGADTLLDLSDDEFQALLLVDLEEPWEDS